MIVGKNAPPEDDDFEDDFIIPDEIAAADGNKTNKNCKEPLKQS